MTFYMVASAQNAMITGECMLLFYVWMGQDRIVILLLEDRFHPAHSRGRGREASGTELELHQIPHH